MKNKRISIPEDLFNQLSDEVRLIQKRENKPTFTVEELIHRILEEEMALEELKADQLRRE